MAAARTKKASTNGIATNGETVALPTTHYERVIIAPPNMVVSPFTITGTSPLVQNRFPNKARIQMMQDQANPTNRTKKKREPKDFDDCFEEAKHVALEGWLGLPACAFRSAMIDACRLVNFKMTFAKLSVFVEADGWEEDGTGLVRLYGEPIRLDAPVRLPNGSCDIRTRPMWRPGWSATVRICYDAGQFSAQDVANLLARAGQQVGVGEGRPCSPNGHGMGWGLFKVVEGDHNG